MRESVFILVVTERLGCLALGVLGRVPHCRDSSVGDVHQSALIFRSDAIQFIQGVESEVAGVFVGCLVAFAEIVTGLQKFLYSIR